MSWTSLGGLLLLLAVVTASVACATPRVRPSRFEGDLTGLQRQPNRTFDELHLDPSPALGRYARVRVICELSEHLDTLDTVYRKPELEKMRRRCQSRVSAALAQEFPSADEPGDDVLYVHLTCRIRLQNYYVRASDPGPNRRLFNGSAG